MAANLKTASGVAGGRHLAPQEIVDMFTTKHREAQASISRIANLSNEDKNALRRFLDQLKQEHDKIVQKHKTEHEQVFRDCQQLKQQLDASKRQVLAVNAELARVAEDRSAILTERDALFLKINQLTLRSKSSDERLRDVEKSFATQTAELMEKLEYQKQQLSGKRAIWLEHNPQSDARRDAVVRLIKGSQDPFDSPTASYTPGFSEHRLTNMGEMASSSVLTSLNTKGSKRRTGLPTGKALPAPAPLKLSSTPRIITEPGNDQTSMAMIVHRPEIEVLTERFKALTHGVYSAIDIWVRKNTSKPSVENDRKISATNQVNWHSMLEMVAPYRTQDAHSHVVALLNNTETRSWFVFRMLVSYCTKNILNFDAFKMYSRQVAAILDECKDALKERGLANERRQAITDRQVKAVQAIISSPTYEEFRKRVIDHFTTEVRDLVGPLLNHDCERGPAGQELGHFVIKAWELSVRMHSTHVTFQIHYPETGTKFVAATMIPKDTQIDAMQLQLQQSRIKLVLSPAITMRDDRGTTINARSILPAEVLLMG